MTYRLLVPYLLLAFILGNPFSVQSVPFVLYGDIHALAGVTSTHLWFLPCYFMAVILYNLLEIILKNKWLFVVAIIVMGLSSHLLDSQHHLVVNILGYTIHLTGNGVTEGKHLYIGLPFAINVAFSGMVLIYIDTILRKVIDRVPDIKKPCVAIPCIIVCITIGTGCFYYNDGAERLLAMSMADYGNYFLFIGAAVFLGFATILISMFVDNPLFSKFGKYTFPIYAFHLSIAVVGAYFMKVLPDIIRDNPEVTALVNGTIT